MRHKIGKLFLILSLLCFGMSIVSCGKKQEVLNNNNNTEQAPVISVLLNGFETAADMYKVRQHTYMQNDKYTGYSAQGKLQIVNKDNFIPVEREYKKPNVHKAEDMAPRQGEGALYINYVSEIAEQGGFTQLIARFSRYDLADAPMEQLGGISVQIYNDNSTKQKATLSLVKSDLSIVSLGDNAVTLAPYAWTDCKVEFNPAIVEYFYDDIVGISVEFDNKNDAVYYLDNLCLNFEQVYTEDMEKQVELVKALENDISEQVAGQTITVESKDVLAKLFARYLELPEEYQGIVKNYTVLSDAITKYMSLIADEELRTKGEVAILRFHEIFGVTQVTDSIGCKATFTSKVHAPGEEGSLCVKFDGSTDWSTLFVAPRVAVYDEIRVWVKNDSDFARVVNLDWQTLATSGGKAYDEEGNEIIDSLAGVDYKNNILGQGGWIQLVFCDQIPVSHFNLSSYDVKTNQVKKSEGKVYIGKVLATSIVAELIERIDALKEKKTYNDEQLMDILDLYLKTSELSKEQKNLLGLERVEKITNIYNANASKILNVKIGSLKVKAEYSAAEIAEILDIQKLYDELSKAQKGKINVAVLTRIMKKIADHNKRGPNMDVMAYDEMYAQNLFYSMKEIYGGAKFSVKYQSEINNGNVVSITLPETIADAKRIKIAVKNTSDKAIAFWPKVTDAEGGLWVGPNNHEVIITAEEGWVELVYDVDGMTIDSLLATYGPWENGNLSFYIGKIEVVTDLAKEVKSEITRLSALLGKKEFSATEIRQIQDLKAMYDGLTAAEKSRINAKKLNKACKRLAKYDKSGKNMNVLAYDTQYGNMLHYSVKEVIKGEDFSMKIKNQITDKGAVTINLPEVITGKKLKITVKNTSDKAIAFWPRETEAKGGEWMAPINHDVIINPQEGWVELVYDIDDSAIDAWVATYGPWENGELSVCIGKIEVVTSNLAEIKGIFKNLTNLSNKDEFTAEEISLILEAKKTYDSMSKDEKKEIDTAALNALMKKIQNYNTSGIYMDVTAYDSKYQTKLSYSLKEKLEGATSSIKLSQEMSAGEAYLVLPKTIYGNKELTIVVKNVSDEPIAFWPKTPDSQGGAWLAPTNHDVIIRADEGWVELTYDVAGLTIESFVTTYGPWKSGDMELYIGGIEGINTYLPIIEKKIEGLANVVTKKQFTASEVARILEVKKLYDSKLTDAEKKRLDTPAFLETAEKLESLDVTNANMNVTRYDSVYGDIVHLSLEEKLDGKEYSLKLEKDLGVSEGYVKLPEMINGAKTVTFTVKNTSGKAVAFWPKIPDSQGGEWLAPTNHDVIIGANEGWIELTYDIDGLNIDTLVMTYGPWESGKFELYIGKIELGDKTTTTNKQLSITGTTGSSYSETADGIKVEFNGTAAWCDINFETIEAGKEIHIFMKNDSDSRRIVQVDWTGANKVLDANGNDVTASVVDGVNTILPANSGWLEVIYSVTSGGQLNCCSLQGETGGTAINGVGALYIKGYSVE